MSHEAGPTDIPFPYQNILTSKIRFEAGRQSDSQYLSMWAGQGFRMIRDQTTEEIITDLADEIEQALS